MWREIMKWNADQPKAAQIQLKDLVSSKRRRDREKVSDNFKDGLHTTKRDVHLRDRADFYNVTH